MAKLILILSITNSSGNTISVTDLGSYDKHACDVYRINLVEKLNSIYKTTAICIGE